ncbi:hypothetical protein HMPREF9071_0848 [Capnocytophaga sp. oral taxon 338 str. F0234]|nr:hypothetical protein HMPREF9071_0848 [Capnocytophaga sp. oral taxon 338 str. F0234]
MVFESEKCKNNSIFFVLSEEKLTFALSKRIKKEKPENPLIE